MNKVITSLFFVLLSLLTKAQTYIPLPESDAEWQTHQSNWDPGTNTGSFWFYCTHPSGDTLLNGIKYTKLIRYRDHIATTASYQGAFRNDTAQRTVYFIPANSTGELLMYDFNVTIGDTLTFSDNSRYPVSQISNQTIAGKSRKVIKISSVITIPNSGTFYYQIIEGLGSNMGLLNGLNAPRPTVQSVSEGTCFINNGQQWSASGTQNCVFTSVQNVNPDNHHALVYPNPAGKYLNIDMNNVPQGSYRLELVNLLGEKILLQDMVVNKANDIILPEHLPNTICFYRIMSNTTVIEQGKLMLQ